MSISQAGGGQRAALARNAGLFASALRAARDTHSVSDRTLIFGSNADHRGAKTRNTKGTDMRREHGLDQAS